MRAHDKVVEQPRNGARALMAAASLALIASCVSAAQRPFPLRPIQWTDDDRTPHAGRPAPRWSPLAWDATDHMAFRRLTQLLILRPSTEAVNVNALDEVPDSTWYQNRLSIRDLAPEQVFEGACAGHPTPDPLGPWSISLGKPGGATPGFIARGSDGNRYVVKIDGLGHPEISTAADVIGSRLFWAAGYNTPCNLVLSIPRASLQILPSATYRDDFDRRHPFTSAHLDEVLRYANRDARGHYRLGVSLFIEGTPLGPFRFEDTRDGDANDRIEHDDRRDLRGVRLLSAWLNHWDSREQNSLTSWVSTDATGHGYVMHYFLDFSDALGGYMPFDRITRQLGYSYYVDFPHILEDFFSLGLIDRPWHHVRVDPRAPVFGYFSADQFVPEQWHPGYPNPAFDRMTERDGAWMARILSRMTDEVIRAAVAAGHFSRPEYESYAVRTLAARRDVILARYLTSLSPLTDFEIHGRSLCATDRALVARVYTSASYTARSLQGFGRTRELPVQTHPRGVVCIELPAPEAEPPAVGHEASRYRVVEVAAVPTSRRASAPIRFGLYDRGASDGYALAGVER